MPTKSLIPSSWEVPEVFRRRLGAKVGRQRLMVADEHLLLVLHLPPGPDEPEREGRLIWRRPDNTWTSTDLGGGPKVVAKHLEEYEAVVQKCDETEEHARSVDDYFRALDALSPVLRATRHLHQVLQEARQACPDDRELINFRDRAYEIERNAELLYNETKNSMEFAVAKRAEEQAISARRMAVSSHRLNMLAAFFFPLATLSTIFGTSLRHGLENYNPPLPLIGLVGLGLLSGCVLTAFLMASRDTPHS